MALDNKIAAKLWSALSISVDRFHAKIVVHPKSVFLGYADITILQPGLEGFALKIRGVDVKMLKGNAHIDFPSERGADGVFYPQFFPKTAEMRAVLTTAIFADERVKDTVEAAANEPVDVQEESTPAEDMEANPFTDN